jgi:serine/threonine protein phosphatase PrpC
MNAIGRWRLIAAAATDKGPVRASNEDAHLIDLDLGLVALSDGMGGHQDGEIASRTALSVLHAELRTARSDADAEPVAGADALQGALYNAHNHLLELNRARSRRDSMGTTIVGLVFEPRRDQARLFHVGDSRAYLWRKGGLVALTRDHSAYEEWRAAGGTAPAPPRNILSQAFGVRGSFAPTLASLTIDPDDLIILCSDGVTDVLDCDAMRAVLDGLDRGALPEGCAMLVEAALQAGARDNVTTLLVSVTG